MHFIDVWPKLVLLLKSAKSKDEKQRILRCLALTFLGERTCWNATQVGVNLALRENVFLWRFRWNEVNGRLKRAGLGFFKRARVLLTCRAIIAEPGNKGHCNLDFYPLRQRLINSDAFLRAALEKKRDV